MRWMLFVDGEGLAIRLKELAAVEDFQLGNTAYYEPDTFAWFPKYRAGTRNFVKDTIYPGIFGEYLEPNAIRSYYFSSVQGDDAKLQDVRQRLWELGFQPELFKKEPRKKRKGVDIALCTEMLSNTYNDTFDVAVLIAGDADFVPLVNAVKSRGKRVFTLFFKGNANGMSDQLRLASDAFGDLSAFAKERWTTQR